MNFRFFPTAKYNFIVDSACLSVLFHVELRLHLSNKVRTGICCGIIKHKSRWGE